MAILPEDLKLGLNSNNAKRHQEIIIIFKKNHKTKCIYLLVRTYTNINKHKYYEKKNSGH